MNRLLFFLLIIPTMIFAHTKPFIGVSVKELPDSLNSLGKGVLIDDVIIDSPAYAKGLKTGDVIISIDDNNLKSISELKKAIEKCKPYQNIKIGIIHNGKKHFIKLKLDKIDEKIYLGVGILKVDNKLLINDIVEGSPAEKGELLLGDEIVAIGNKKVTDPKQIAQILDEKGYDKDISIKIIRKNKVIEKNVFLFYWDANLLKKTIDIKNREFFKDMKRIFPILDEK